MKMKIPKQSFTAIVIVSLASLWIRELSLRKAIEEADHYIMPFVVSGNLFRTAPHQFTFFDMMTDLGTVKFKPGWYIGYEPVDVLANGISVRVPMFGKATGTTHGDLTHALNLPFGEERKQAIEKLLND
ncbi:hypothetical protein P4C99_21330 [Pontiellaceae bacterium B1224]|nr:hypothetical protein [Pontiellaceae bacterium B1224]